MIVYVISLLYVAEWRKLNKFAYNCNRSRDVRTFLNDSIKDKGIKSTLL